MYWLSSKEGGRLYADAAEYGIVCGVQDLGVIVERLDKYIKKTKVRGAGLSKRFGVSHYQRGTGVESWLEWIMDAGAVKTGALTAEQGKLWHFELCPNRRFHIARRGHDHDQDEVREVYAFPERKDLAYIVILIKDQWFCERQGKQIRLDSEDDLRARERFFQGLLDCIGFPLEPLHVYDKDEERVFR